MNSPSTFSSFSTSPAYNVKAVCVRTGIAAATLRAWERRYGLPSPYRSGQGYRLYSERDIAMLNWLKRQTNCGINIAHAAAQLRGMIESGTPIDLDVRGLERVSPGGLRSPHILKAEIERALCQQDKRHFDGLMSEALALYTPETTLVMLLQGAVRAIRAGKAAGTLSHTAATLAVGHAHQYLVHLAQTLPTARGQNKPVAVVGFSSENNEFDLMLLNILLRRQGIPTLPLGADLDPRMLEQAAAQIDAGMFVFYADEPRNIVRLVGLSHFKDAGGDPVRIACCGMALQLAPELRPHIQIDYLGADLHEVTNHIVEYINPASRKG